MRAAPLRRLHASRGHQCDTGTSKGSGGGGGGGDAYTNIRSGLLFTQPPRARRPLRTLLAALRPDGSLPVLCLPLRLASPRPVQLSSPAAASSCASPASAPS